MILNLNKKKRNKHFNYSIVARLLNIIAQDLEKRIVHSDKRALTPAVQNLLALKRSQLRL